MKALFIISIIVAALFTYAFPAAIIQLIRSLKKMRKVSRMQKFTIAVGILIAIVVICGLWYVPVRLNQKVKASKADIEMVTEEPGTSDPVDEIVLQ